MRSPHSSEPTYPFSDRTETLYEVGSAFLLNSDHDPLFQFHQWKANLRVLEVEEIKTLPYAPLSHPFVERLIGTIRREYLDRTLFWTTANLEEKLLDFKHYNNGHRAHAGLEGRTLEGSDQAGSIMGDESVQRIGGQLLESRPGKILASAKAEFLADLFD